MPASGEPPGADRVGSSGESAYAGIDRTRRSR